MILDFFFKFSNFVNMNLIKIRNNSLSSGYGMETGQISSLRNGNRKLEILRFPFRKTELSRNSDLRNKFPDHSISKMEIFFRKNGNSSMN